MTGPPTTVGLTPGSLYAGELNRGAVEMRFPPELERQYHRFYLAERRAHVRSFNLLMLLLIGLGSGYALLVQHARADLAQRLELAAIVIGYLVMVFVAYSRHYERLYLELARGASVAISLAAAILVAGCIHGGAAELFGLLTAFSIGLYFLAAILYQAAVQANVVMVIAFGGALVCYGETAAKGIELTLILAATAAIGGIAFRQQGMRFRRNFLERGLVAERAVHDHLTGLTNRRGFDEHLTRTWQQALRDRRRLVLLLCDVDHFKKFNDRYGHQAGDAALQRIAGVIRSFAQRPLDLGARYGGEELALILFDLSRERAALLAQQLRRAVEGLQIPHAGSSYGVVTVSIGVAIVHPTLERSPDGAVQLADEALYAAKGEGRNAVRLSEDEYQALATGTFRMP